MNLEKQVLLLEDNELNAQILQIYLKRMHLIVHWFSEGKEALKELSSGKLNPELILLDHQLETESGVDWTIQLRREFPFLKIPIVSISAHLQQEEIDKNLCLGIAGFLIKPIHEKELTKLTQHIHGIEQKCLAAENSSMPLKHSGTGIYMGVVPPHRVRKFWLNQGFEKLEQQALEGDYLNPIFLGLLQLAKWNGFIGLYLEGMKHLLGGDTLNHNSNFIQELSHVKSWVESDGQ